MYLYLVRHGETAENRARIVQPADVPLSAKGHQQAQALAKRLVSANITQIICSDLPRTRQTASQFLALKSVPVTYDALLQERNFGDLRGQAYDAIGDDFFAEEYRPPNGESWADFHHRVAQAWAMVKRVISEHEDGDLLVITHGLVCRALAARHLCIPDHLTMPSSWQNTSVTVATLQAPHTITQLNDVSHLQDDVSGAKGAQV